MNKVVNAEKGNCQKKRLNCMSVFLKADANSKKLLEFYAKISFPNLRCYILYLVI